MSNRSLLNKQYTSQGNSNDNRTVGCCAKRVGHPGLKEIITPLNYFRTVPNKMHVGILLARSHVFFYCIWFDGIQFQNFNLIPPNN